MKKEVCGKLLCAIAIALLIFSFSPFSFVPVSADVSLQNGKWSDYYYFLSPNFSNEVDIFVNLHITYVFYMCYFFINILLKFKQFTSFIRKI